MLVLGQVAHELWCRVVASLVGGVADTGDVGDKLAHRHVSGYVVADVAHGHCLLLFS